MERINAHERRELWWIYVIGMSSIFTFGFLHLLDDLGAAEFLDFVATFSGDAMLILHWIF